MDYEGANCKIKMSNRGMQGVQEILSEYCRDDDTERMTAGEGSSNVWTAKSVDK